MITITLSWHLILMVVISIIFIVGAFKEKESSLDLTGIVNIFILIVLWLIYGGIFVW